MIKAQQLKFQNILLFLIGISVGVIPTLASANWVVTELGSFENDNSIASSINDSGQIVININNTSNIYAFITGSNGVGMTKLLENGYASSINNHGQVTGFSTVSSGEYHAFLTGKDGIGITDIGVLAEGGISTGLNINDSGQVVGYSTPSSYVGVHAFITDKNSGGMVDLGTLGGHASFAYSINESGQVVGLAQTDDDNSRAFITEANGINMKDLGTLGGDNSAAFDINDSGQVTGVAQTIEGFSHAFITGTNGLGMIDIGTLGGLNSYVYSLNNLGEVVGNADTVNGENHAYLFSNSVMTDLSLIPSLVAPGWVFIPMDINNNGQIVGYRMNELDGKAEAILLSPIP